MSMKAVSIKGGTGPSTALFIEDVPLPVLKADQALVEVKAFALNRMDIIQREGHYPLPEGASHILGVEFSGVIKEIHSDVNKSESHNSSFKTGDKVFGLVVGGAYAQYVAADLDTLIHIPEELSFEEAASIPEVWFTAIQVLEVVGGLKANDRVVFHSGASSVGLAALQISQAAGAEYVFTTVGSDEKKDYIKQNLILKDFPASHVVPINYRTEDFAKVIESTLSNESRKGVDLIIDPIGKSYFNSNLASLAVEGRLVLMGGLSGLVVEQVNLQQVLFKRLKIEGTTLRARPAEYKRKIRNLVEDFALPRIISKDFGLHVEKVTSWKSVVEAHQLLESNTSKGKIICLVD